MLTLALIVLALALLLAVWWLYSRGLIVHAAVLLWVAFVPYEIWFRANCPGECNIRADLVFLLPPLLAVALAAMISVVRKALRKRKAHPSR
jgi:hypothetical protein